MEPFLKHTHKVATEEINHSASTVQALPPSSLSSHALGPSEALSPSPISSHALGPSDPFASSDPLETPSANEFHDDSPLPPPSTTVISSDPPDGDIVLRPSSPTSHAASLSNAPSFPSSIATVLPESHATLPFTPCINEDGIHQVSEVVALATDSNRNMDPNIQINAAEQQLKGKTSAKPTTTMATEDRQSCVSEGNAILVTTLAPVPAAGSDVSEDDFMMPSYEPTENDKLEFEINALKERKTNHI